MSAGVILSAAMTAACASNGKPARTVAAEFVRAWNARDPAAASRLLAPDFIEIRDAPEPRHILTSAQVLSGFNEPDTDDGEKIGIRASREIAHTSGHVLVLQDERCVTKDLCRDATATSRLYEIKKGCISVIQYLEGRR